MTAGVVITGMGAVTPLGVGTDALFERWSEGECAVDDGLARCGDFEVTDHLSRKEARRTDRFTHFAMVSADEALSAAWPDGLPYEPERIGCVISTGIGGLGSLERQQDVLRDRGPTLENECRAWIEGGDRAVSPHFVPMMMPNAAAGTIAMRVGAYGPGFSVASACATGSHAIGEAMRLIERGEADVVVAGGTEAALTGLCLAAFKRMGALSREGISRPFDARRDGFVMGEGAGVLVLESAEKASARGAEPVAEILGYAASSDAHHLTAPEPSGRDAARAIELALADADVKSADIDYVNAHGTSTPLNDRSETEALKAALGNEDAHRIPISSTKSAIGHLLGAAGALETIITALAMRDSYVPPTINQTDPDPECDLDYIPNVGREADVEYALTNSFGFGGHNAVLCLAA